MIIAAVQKDWFYHLTYWLTALLPVILGFGITMLIIWYLTKTYKGPENLDEFEDEDEA